MTMTNVDLINVNYACYSKALYFSKSALNITTKPHAPIKLVPNSCYNPSVEKEQPKNTKSNRT